MRRRSAWSPFSLLLIAVMALGSVLMWIGVPVGLVYLASRVADSPTPTLGPYLLIVIGLPVGMVVIARPWARSTATTAASPASTTAGPSRRSG